MRAGRTRIGTAARSAASPSASLEQKKSYFSRKFVPVLFTSRIVSGTGFGAEKGKGARRKRDGAFCQGAKAQ